MMLAQQMVSEMGEGEEDRCKTRTAPYADSLALKSAAIATHQ